VKKAGDRNTEAIRGKDATGGNQGLADVRGGIASSLHRCQRPLPRGARMRLVQRSLQGAKGGGRRLEKGTYQGTFQLGDSRAEEGRERTRRESVNED